MSVVGIDFGTSKCVVAVCQRGEIKTVTNEVSNRSSPSMVGYGERRRFIGESAQSQWNSNWKHTVTDAKLFLGKTKDNKHVGEDLKRVFCSVSTAEDGSVVFHTAKNETLSATQVTAALFGELIRIAHAALGTPAAEAVISVPPFYTEAERRAVENAASIAGLKVLSLMNDCTAVGVQYGLLRQLPEDTPVKVIFFDVGYAHSHASLAEVMGGKLEIKATFSERSGGRDWDDVVMKLMLGRVKELGITDVEEHPKAMLRLRREAEKIKKVLSANQDSHWGMECFLHDKDISGVVTRDQLEEGARSTLERALGPLKKVLALPAAKSFEAVEVIGGGSRVPSLMQGVNDLVGEAKVKKTCDGDEAVARGCALQAAMLSPKFKVKEFKVHDVTPYAIQVAFGPIGGNIKGDSVLYSQFNAIPCVKMMNFLKAEPFEIQLRYHSDADVPSGTHPILGRFVLPSVPRQNAEVAPKVKVKFSIDVGGVLSVIGATMVEDITTLEPEEPAEGQRTDETAAEEEAKKPKKKVRKTPIPVESVHAGGLTQDALNVLIDIEAVSTGEDQTVATTLAKKNDLESLCYALRDKVDFEATEFFLESEKEALMAKIDEYEEWLYGDGEYSQKSDYTSRIQELQKLSMPALSRQWEFENLPEAINNLKKVLLATTSEAASSEKYDHIPDEIKELVTSCKETDQWLTEQQVAHEHRANPKTDTPIILCEELNKKSAELRTKAEKVFKIAKPAPKPEPSSESNMESDVKSENKDGSNKTADEMDVDKNAGAEESMDVDGQTA